MKHVLEPEDEHAREKRIRIALERLNQKATSSEELPSAPDFGERRTYPVDAPAELLSRVQTFLPQIEASNALLAEQVRADPRSADIEALESSDTRVIEMNLGLGVFKIRHKNGQPGSSESDLDESTSDSDDSDGDSDNSSSSDEKPVHVSQSNLGLANAAQHQHRPVIEELIDSDRLQDKHIGHL